jgi:predicted RNase H-like HicB family nuclease
MDSEREGALMEATTFTALCERAGRWWTVRVPQVEGLTAQVRSLEQAEIMTRQSIGRALGLPLESIRVEVVTDAPAPVSQALQARHTARQAVEAAVEATKIALEALLQEGYLYHDAATLLGLSSTEITQYASHVNGTVNGTADGPSRDVQASGPLEMAGQ